MTPDPDRFWLDHDALEGELLDNEALRPARERLDQQAADKIAAGIRESEKRQAEREAPLKDVYVFRVRYLLNTIEVLDLVKRTRSGQMTVRDEAGVEATIATRDVFDSFGAAKERLVQLNAEKFALARIDLERAENRLILSQAMSLG